MGDANLVKAPLIVFLLRSLVTPMKIVVVSASPHSQDQFVSINMLLLFDREFKDAFVPIYLEEFPIIYKHAYGRLRDLTNAFYEFVGRVQYCEVDRDPYAEENELLREALLKLGFPMPPIVHYEDTQEEARWSSFRFSHADLIQWYAEEERPLVYDVYINSIHCQLFHAGTSFLPTRW